MNAVEVRSLSKSFKKQRALDDISLDVQEGEIFGLIGPDGAGKTTLIRILTSLQVPDSGSCTVLGIDPIREMKKLRKVIGYMPGRFSLYQDLSVEENLSLFASIFNTTIEENYHLIRDIYSQIEPFRKRKAGALSGGMKQKLALSCAMIHRPEILFLDEPTTGVDPVSRKEFWEMLGKLNRQGLTILVSTPYMDEAAKCHRVGLIQGGRILAVNQSESISQKFPHQLFAVTGTPMNRLIKALRDFNQTISAYSFGSEIHLSVDKGFFDQDALLTYLEKNNIDDRRVRSISPGIEDTFISLLKEKQLE
jgi:ABC-type multidrug transport system ATPase subunit